MTLSEFYKEQKSYCLVEQCALCKRLVDITITTDLHTVTMLTEHRKPPLPSYICNSLSEENETAEQV